jgi:hypothetical protein
VGTLQEIHIFSPNFINTAIVGYSRGAFTSHGVTLPPYTYPADLTMVQGHPMGTISIASGASESNATIASGGSNGIFDNRRNLFTYEDTAEIVKGKNQFGVGAWFKQVEDNESGSVRGNGTASFTDLQTFLTATTTSFQAAPSAIPLYWRTLDGAFFAQDNIQLLPNLELEAGLRYEFDNGWNEKYGHASNYDTTDGILNSSVTVGHSALTANNATHLLGPRLGLAWSPFKNGRTAVHAGFGVHYMLEDNMGFQFNSQPPFAGVAAYTNANILSIWPLSSTTPLAAACGPGVPTPCTTYAPGGVQSNFKVPTVDAYTLKIDQQITGTLALDVAYVGSHASHEMVTTDMNTIQPQVCASPTGCLAGGVNKPAQQATVSEGTLYIPVGTRPDPYLSAASLWESIGASSYNALQVDVTKHISYGLEARANYTWSKSLDLGSTLSGVGQQNEPSILMDRYDPGLDWGPSAQDIQQQVSGNFSYNLPIGQNQEFLNSLKGVSNGLVSGWQVNGIVTLLSGFPLTPQDGSNISGDGDTKLPDRPNRNPAFTGSPLERKRTQWINPNAYVLPTYGTYGNASRGSLVGPGLAEVNFSLFKTTNITERTKLELRAEAFNILNHTNLGLPNSTIFSGTIYGPTVGDITNTNTTSRQLQMAVKLLF